MSAEPSRTMLSAKYRVHTGTYRGHVYWVLTDRWQRWSMLFDTWNDAMVALNDVLAWRSAQPRDPERLSFAYGLFRRDSARRLSM